MDSNPNPNPNPNPTSSSSLHPSNYKASPFPAPLDTQLDLYTIPSHSCWFSWDSIHETERLELREFFDGSSFTRTPKIYKEYRDFIISKYREEPSRRLCFTEVRKSLVGDVSVLRKVFNFLDKWGLINFGASTCGKVDKEDDNVKVRVENGAPVGIRVVNLPNSAKPLVVVPPVRFPSSGGGENGFKLPPLASYSDVFEGFREKSGVVCGNCKDKCGDKLYECTKEKYVICLKCFEKGTYGGNKSADDFKSNDSSGNGGNQGAVWTEAETLLLLESVLKHGDDWDLVAQNVKTKSKVECISRLIELPIGQLMLGSLDKCSPKGINAEADVVQGQKESSESQKDSDVVQEQKASSESQDKTDVNEEQKALNESQQETDANQEQKALGESQEKTDVNEEQKASSESQEKTDVNQEQKASSESQEKTDVNQEQKASSESQEKTDVNQEQKASSESQETNKVDDDMDKIESVEPPLKKQRIDSSDPSRSLMEQVALISSMVGSEITATAASAAVSVLSDGNSLVRDIFYAEDHTLNDDHRSGNLDRELENALHSEDSEMKDASEDDKMCTSDSIPLALRTRAAVGTALGAAAAHARLLADQEEREIEHLMAFVIETQLKKMKRKATFFEDLEHLMEKENSVLEELKDSIIEDRMGTLQKILSAGIPRWKDHSSSVPGGA